MAWTAPITALSGLEVTAADFNTYVRDNLLETAPAKATIGGRMICSTGMNSVVQRDNRFATVNTSESTASTVYTNLATVGPSVTITTGVRAMVFISARMRCNSSGQSALVAIDVSGATTEAASDTNALQFSALGVNTEIRYGGVFVFPGLTSGSNIFALMYRVTGGTGFFARRNIIVLPL